MPRALSSAKTKTELALACFIVLSTQFSIVHMLPPHGLCSSGCFVYEVNFSVVANCSNLNWTHVDLSCLPIHTEVLLLDNNNLTTLKNATFQNLTSLKRLSLSGSNIRSIETDTFLGLSQLEILSLDSNQLSSDTKTFNPLIFKHFQNLKELYIANNEGISLNLKYYFPNLQNISTLSMDGSTNLSIESNFSLLTHLTNLTILCTNVMQVTNTSFQGLWNSSLKVLRLINFERLEIDPDSFDFNSTSSSSLQFDDEAFRNLNMIEVLEISNCKIGNLNIVRIFQHFINSLLHTVILDTTHFTWHFNAPDSTFKDGVLKKSSLMYLTEINLTQLSWVNSNIFAIAPGIMSSPHWRHSMNKLDLSGNNLGILGWREPLMEISRFEKLEEVILSSSYVSDTDIYPTLKYMNVKDMSRIPDIYFANHSKITSPSNNLKFNTTLLNGKNEIKKYPHNMYKTSLPNTYLTNQKIITSEPSHYADHGHLSFKVNPPFPTNSGTWTVRMPLALRILRVINLLQGDTNFGNQSVKFIQTSDEAANLTHFYYIGNDILRGTGHIRGLTSLQLFDVSQNTLYVEDHFFDHLPSLRYLILKSIKNEDFFQQRSLKRLVQNLPELRYLDVTDNNLNFLPPNLFARNPRISHLILSKNRFFSIPITMSQVPNLRFLDLCGNSLIYLDNKEMSSVSQHRDAVPDFQLALAENSLTYLTLIRDTNYTFDSYLEEDLKVSTFVHHRDLGPGYTDQQMFEAMRESWRILLIITKHFLNNYDLSDIIMKFASHSVTLANQGRVVALIQQSQLHNIPGYLYDVLEDSRIIVLSDLTSYLDYVQRQAMKECLRDIQ
uniref:TIR domain-containing protein n=1 Tax=Biomphalaria glabrata TaxID=6526 RepID=A0A2C9LDE3_BIOGL